MPRLIICARSTRHRIVWSVPLLALLITVGAMRRCRSWYASAAPVGGVFRIVEHKLAELYFCCSHCAEAALGYYINPGASDRGFVVLNS